MEGINAGDERELVDAEDAFSRPYLERRNNRPFKRYCELQKHLQDSNKAWTKQGDKSSIQTLVENVRSFPYIDRWTKERFAKCAARLLDTFPDQGELVTVGAHHLETTTTGDKPSTPMMEYDGIDLSTEDRKPAASGPKTMTNSAASGPETMTNPAASGPKTMTNPAASRPTEKSWEQTCKELIKQNNELIKQNNELVKQNNEHRNIVQRKNLIIQLKNLVESIVYDVHLLVINVVLADVRLSTLSCLSQAELTANFVGDKTNAAAIKYIKEHAPGAVSTANIAKEVVDKKKELPTAKFLPIQDDDLDKALLRVSTAYESLITNACEGHRILKNKRKSRNYKASYKAKMDKSMKWFRSCVAENSAGTDPHLWFPGLEGQEVDGAQVMLTELIRAVGNCFNHECNKNLNPDWKFSPPKTSVKREAVVAGTEKRHKRIVDLTASKPGQFQLVMLDHNIRLPCEMKPVLRSRRSKDDESCEQILSHLGKACYDGLTFLEIGTSTMATGLTSNLACIQVHQLHLEMHTADSTAGTPPVKVELYQSGRLPLMSAACFDLWVKECGESNNQDIEKLRADLYGGATIGSVPSGLRALYGVMAKRRTGAFGPDYQKLFEGNEGVGKVLGHGSFGVVMEYSDGESDDYVLKVPRFPEGKSFLNEQKVLKALENCKCSYISKLVMQKQLVCSIGNMMVQVPGLVLTPRGIPLPYLRQTEKLLPRALDGFVTNMLEALEVIHRENIHHNDIAPKNIVVVKKGKDWKAVLVDFGNATMPGEKVAGFIGHVHYVHDDVLSKYPSEEWTPEDKHDLAALAFSMAAVFGGGEATWDMKGLPCSSKIGFEDVLNNRRVEAKRWLGQYKGKDLTTFIDDSSPSKPRKSKRKEPTSPNDLCHYNLRSHKRKKL